MYALLNNINHHIWYKVCKPLRKKYGLSTNCVMVLNGSFVYCTYVHPSFTRYQLLKFVSYYNMPKIGSYITVLMGLGFINSVDSKNTRKYYCISSKGIEVIKDFEESYNRELNKFIELYKIVL